MSNNGNNHDLAESARTVASSVLSMTWTAHLMAIEARRSIRFARQIRENLTPTLLGMLQNDVEFRRRYQASMLNWMVDSAIRVTGADMANLQLFDPVSKSLRIEAQRGFNDPFLEFFGSVEDGHAACGTAFKTRQRVIVDDVAESPIFRRTDALEVLLDARVRAVQSTPLVGRSGLLLGVISTHWASPYRPSSRQLCSLDLLSRVAADCVEHRLPRRSAMS